MNATELLTRLKAHPGVDDDSRVGIVSSFGRKAEVIEKADTRDIVVVANTADIDLENEVVVPSGADTTYIANNKQMFADHKYDLDQVVGSVRRLDPYPSVTDHEAWRVRAHVHNNPLGNAVMTIVRETGQIGTSVGFVALDYGPPDEDERKAYKSPGGDAPRSIVRRWRWFELSFTALPCNVACQSLTMTEGKSVVDMRNAVDQLVTKGLVDRAAAHALGMPIDPVRKYHAVGTPVRKRLIPIEVGGEVVLAVKAG